MPNTLAKAALLATWALFAVGCSGRPSRLHPPKIDPSGSAGGAIEKYDKNGDGAVARDELTAAPGLLVAFARIDFNNDGKITADELAARMNKWLESRLALSSMNARVRMNGAPLRDATVTIVPEAFLGEAVKPAKGTTDEEGFARVRISADPDENGVHLGFYRIEVSKQAGGKETIPAKYNANSELGVEVAPDVLETQNLGIDLQGR